MAENGSAKPGTFEQGMNVAKGEWYTEISSLWPGQGLSLKVDEVLFQSRSKFQVQPSISSSSTSKALSHLACTRTWTHVGHRGSLRS